VKLAEEEISENKREYHCRRQKMKKEKAISEKL